MAEEEGFIPRFDVSVPQDIIDATMRDMERYLNTLVREEQGLGNLIEVNDTQKIFNNPEHELTKNYISGRTG